MSVVPRVVCAVPIQAIAARLEEAKREAARQEEERKAEMLERQREQDEKERRRREFQAQQREEAARAATLEAHKRALILEETRKEEELRKEALVAKQDEVRPYPTAVPLCAPLYRAVYRSTSASGFFLSCELMSSSSFHAVCMRCSC
jgi:hypothetical protein